MAKFYGNAVKTGKLGGSVFAIRFGETIERQYQPVVANPSTTAQVASRAKLKLMSQLAAVMAPVIAIARQGAVSSRNLFTKVNYKLATYANNSADIPIADVQLTKSVVGLPYLTATRQGSSVTVELSRGDNDVNRVAYAVFIKESDNRLRFLSSTVVSVAGASNTYPETIDVGTSLPVTVLAYGVRDNTDAARAYFDDLGITAENIAQVVATRQLTEADVTLTETRGIDVAAPGA